MCFCDFRVAFTILCGRRCSTSALQGGVDWSGNDGRRPSASGCRGKERDSLSHRPRPRGPHKCLDLGLCHGISAQRQHGSEWLPVWWISAPCAASRRSPPSNARPALLVHIGCARERAGGARETGRLPRRAASARAAAVYSPHGSTWRISDHRRPVDKFLCVVDYHCDHVCSKDFLRALDRSALDVSASRFGAHGNSMRRWRTGSLDAIDFGSQARWRRPGCRFDI